MGRVRVVVYHTATRQSLHVHVHV
eukprot:COSAG02_NODE_41092_length_398_cov_0.856187_1_plen_23_part_10